MPEAPTEYYTSRYSGEEIDRGVAGGLTMGGAETSQEALYNLGAGVRPNLLDNAYFAGRGTGWGVFPVNQKGKTQATESGYFIDRWVVNFATETAGIVSLSTDSVSFNVKDNYINFFQKIRNTELSGKTLTVSCLYSGGPLNLVIGVNGSFPFNQSYPKSDSPTIAFLTFTLPQNITTDIEVYSKIYSNCDIFAKKLEIGNNQTLSYQDSGGTWNLLPQLDMDYRTQLAKCQRYLIPIKTQGRYVGSVNSNGADGRFFIPTPVTIRTNPTIVDAVFTAFSGGSQVSLAQKISGATALPNGVEVFFSGVSGLQSNSIIVVYANTSGFLSAEL